MFYSGFLKRMPGSFGRVCILLGAAGLSACGLGSQEVDLPPERQPSTVTLDVVGGQLHDSRIAIYSLDNGEKGTLLADTASTNEQRYSASVTSPSTPVLIEVTAGKYIDHSGTSFSLPEDPSLQVISHYTSQQDLTLSLSPLSQVQTGLIEALAAQGLSIAQAEQQATKLFREAFGTDFIHSQSDQHFLHQHYLKAVQQFAAWSQRFNSQPQEHPFDLMLLADILYQDLRSDALLNGAVVTAEDQQNRHLGLGVLALSGSIYKQAMGKQLFGIGNSMDDAAEQQILTEQATRLRVSQHKLFGPQEQFIPAIFKPAILVSNLPQDTIKESLQTQVFVDSILPLAQFQVFIDEVEIVPEEGSNSISLDNTTLSDGEHLVRIYVEDSMGDTDSFSFNVSYDSTPPSIISDGLHGVALMRDHNNFTQQKPIIDMNTDERIVIDTERLELGNTAITRLNLQQQNIPFFAARIYDPSADGSQTQQTLAVVNAQYYLNGEPVDEVPLPEAVIDEYIIPLSKEILPAPWLHSSPDDIHEIVLTAQDEVGNRISRKFAFRVEFQAPQLQITSESGIDAALVSERPFSQRGDIDGFVLRSHRYQFTNTADTDILVRPSDHGIHDAMRYYDKAVRQHDIFVYEHDEWRVGRITNLLSTDDSCPTISEWVPVTELVEYSDRWQSISPSAPEPTEDSIPTDTLGYEEGAWTDATGDYDDNYKSDTWGNSDLSFSYEYDFLDESVNSWPFLTPIPAAVRNWERIDNVGDTSKNDCPDLTAFEKRTITEQVSRPGFPKNTLDEDLASPSQLFFTTGFAMELADSGQAMTPADGWFRIPAGATVTLYKKVQLSGFEPFDDSEVLDLDSFASYVPKRLDQRLEWLAYGDLQLESQHYTGNDKQVFMATRQQQVEAEASLYQWQR